MDPESGYLCHSLPHNSLINPYSYPELPALMMSNMLAQDGHLLSGQMPSVSLSLIVKVLGDEHDDKIIRTGPGWMDEQVDKWS